MRLAAGIFSTRIIVFVKGRAVQASLLGSANGRFDTVARLNHSLLDVLYAASITPEFWRFRTPQGEPGLEWLGSWSVADNLAHLAVYEEQVAAPILEAIREGRDGGSDVMSVFET